MRHVRGAKLAKAIKARAPCMILIEPDSSPTGLTSSIDVLQRQLADLRDDLDALIERVKVESSERSSRRPVSRPTSANG